MPALTRTLVLLFTTILMVMPHAIDAQETTDMPTDWTLLKQQNGVKVYYKYADCTFQKFGWQQSWYLLKFENSTLQPATVDWDAQMYFNDVCKTCNDPNGEYHRTISVAAGQTLEGQCDIDGDYSLVMFAKFNDKPNNTVMTGFSLSNLIVTQ